MRAPEPVGGPAAPGPAAPARLARAVDRQLQRARWAYAVLLISLALVAATSMMHGAASLSDSRLRSAVLGLRASRFGASVLVGSALAVTGVIVQGLFRNPLADVSVLGTSSGAMLGGNAALLAMELLVRRGGMSWVSPEVVLPLGCLAGAVVSLLLLFAFLRRTDDVLSLILAGFLFSSLFLSLGSLVTSVAQERWELGRAVIAFTFGGVAATGPQQLAMALPLVACGLTACWFWAKPLNVLLSGDDEARSLGVDVGQVRRYCVLWVAVLTAGAVTLGGNVGFVGLLVPHALRPMLGPDHRRLVPLAAIGGATFVAACDLLARSLPTQTEVPLGVITGLLGAPAFLALLMHSRRATGR